MKKEIPSLVKWAGGKKQLIEQFKNIFPKRIERYFEPFLGGGSVAFHLLKRHPEIKNVYLSDINKELISIQIAARFIYLKKTCFNGLYRVNTKGIFNVPMGSYKIQKYVMKKTY